MFLARAIVGMLMASSRVAVTLKPIGLKIDWRFCTGAKSAAKTSGDANGAIALIGRNLSSIAMRQFFQAFTINRLRCPHPCLGVSQNV
jgi:hypothetical protein